MKKILIGLVIALCLLSVPVAAAIEYVDSSLGYHNSVGASSSRTLTITQDADVNDILIAQITIGDERCTVTAPEGWVLLSQTSVSGFQNIKQIIYWKKVTSSGSTGYTWTYSGNAWYDRRITGSIMQFKGVDPDSPIFGFSANSGSDTGDSSGDLAATGINGVPANTWLIACFGLDIPDGDLNEPVSMAPWRYNYAPGACPSIAAGTEIWTIGGNTGNRVSYNDVGLIGDKIIGDAAWVAHLVALRTMNTAPVLTGVPATVTISEGIPYTFDADATDDGLPSGTLTFSLSPGAPGSIDPNTGVFTWTPATEGSYTFSVSVTDGLLTDSETITITVTAQTTNQPPVLGPIPDGSVDELLELTFTASATDDGLPTPPGGLTFTLEPAPPETFPEGASLNGATGVFTWTPTEAQGPGSYAFTVVVTDGELSDSQKVTLTVNEVNLPPTLSGVPLPLTINELELYTFTVTATDPDLPANTLAFSLVDAPAGASIGEVTGIFTWTPTEDQAPGVFTFKVLVTDNGIPVLSDEEETTITVNAHPISDAGADQTAMRCEVITLDGSGSSDPENAPMTYSWALGDGTTSTDMRVTHAYSTAGTYTATLVVTDEWGLTDEDSLTVTVRTPSQGVTDLKTVLQGMHINIAKEMTLKSYLNTAQSMMNTGMCTQAVTSLQSFNLNVNGMRGLYLTNDQADTLVAYSNRIIASIQQCGCR